jgi:acyl-homoserine-lactone acylase
VMRVFRKVAGLLCGGALIWSCGAAAREHPEVEVRITKYGVPHIKAADYRGLGLGLGYAFARENLCVLAQQFVTLDGERSRFFGEDASYQDPFAGMGGKVNNLTSDFYYKFLFGPETAAFMRRAYSPELLQMVDGYAEGYNRYLAETPSGKRPEACRGAEWVRPITTSDLLRRQRQMTLLGTSNGYLQDLVAAKPPVAQAAGKPLAERFAAMEQKLAARPRIGSNIVAFGRDLTENGKGLFFGNPHFTWIGTERLYQMQLTIPGKLDVYGAGLYGQPTPFMGFNRDMAWSVTWSTDQRAVVYELPLAPGKSTEYLYDGKAEAMQPVTVSVDVRTADGRTAKREHVFYRTRFGPVLSSDTFPWASGKAYALRDLDLDNNRFAEQFFRIAQARNVKEVHESLAKVMGSPFSNVLAADRNGDTVFTNMSVTANLPKAGFGECVKSDLAKRALSDWNLLVVDGSTSRCELRDDPAAPQKGMLPSTEKPYVFRPDYVMSSNASHWIVNHKPETFLAGFNRTAGDELTARGERSRLAMRHVLDRVSNRDGLGGSKFTLDKFERIFFDGRWLTAEETVDDIVASCRAKPTVRLKDGREVDLVTACEVLARWDRKVRPESVGVPLFGEFVMRLPQPMMVDFKLADDQWKVPFDPADPVDTPRGLPMTELQRQALGEAVLYLRDNGIPLDAKLGDVQYAVRDGKKLPMGGFSTVYNHLMAKMVKGEGYVDPYDGDSFLFLVSFDDKGPVARAVTSYAESTNPASPHFADQTELYSQRKLFDVPFEDLDIANDKDLQVLRLSSGKSGR